MSPFFRYLLIITLLPGFLPAYSQSPLKPRDPSIKGPQTFAIILGVSKYKFVKPLAFADKDAELFRDYLRSPGGGSVKDENIFCLLNDKASNANFWSKGFQWLKAKHLQRGDRLFIYLAGHGDAIDEDQFFFLGYDCNPQGDKNNYLISGAIQLFNLKKKIANETTKGVDVFFIMDACRSNELPGGSSGQNFLNTAISEKKAGEIIMLATGAGQESLEDASIGSGQGLFTYYLVDGLNGMADSSGTPDRRISFREIQGYVNKNVPSIAQQRFKRKQDPYFCCTENSEKIISTVDTGYLRRWLRIKQQQKRGPGNAFNGSSSRLGLTMLADTLLVETYELFNRAIAANNLTGRASAEEYYHQLASKFPGNPYTLDAKSSLAVEFIQYAQNKVDRYLGCVEDLSPSARRENTEAAERLEKAISFVSEDDVEFAQSLRNRLYLLRASGENPTIENALQHAHAALTIDPGAAYAQHKLAQLHLENRAYDSALIYADRAVRTAPNWLCALSTLGLVKNAVAQATKNEKKKNDPSPHKSGFGANIGVGISQLTPRFDAQPNSTIIGVHARDIFKADLGINYFTALSKNMAIRPTTSVAIEGGELVYDRRFATGGPVFHDTLRIKTTSLSLALPVIFYLSNKGLSPFISLGPSFTYVISEEAEVSRIVPVKKTMVLGDLGAGLDLAIGKRWVITPELRYTQGFTNQKGNATNEFANAIASLKKRNFSLSLYLRAR